MNTRMSVSIRRSRKKSSSVPTFPPWLPRRTSFENPLRATEVPMSLSTMRSVSPENVSVPGKSWCSVLLPKFVGGSASTITSSESRASAPPSSSMPTSVSVMSGRCGPCCSTAPMLMTAVALGSLFAIASISCHV